MFTEELATSRDAQARSASTKELATSASAERGLEHGELHDSASTEELATSRDAHACSGGIGGGASCGSGGSSGGGGGGGCGGSCGSSGCGGGGSSGDSGSCGGGSNAVGGGAVGGGGGGNTAGAVDDNELNDQLAEQVKISGGHVRQREPEVESPNKTQPQKPKVQLVMSSPTKLNFKKDEMEME